MLSLPRFLLTKHLFRFIGRLLLFFALLLALFALVASAVTAQSGSMVFVPIVRCGAECQLIGPPFEETETPQAPTPTFVPTALPTPTPMPTSRAFYVEQWHRQSYQPGRIVHQLDLQLHSSAEPYYDPTVTVTVYNAQNQAVGIAVQREQTALPACEVRQEYPTLLTLDFSTDYDYDHYTVAIEHSDTPSGNCAWFEQLRRSSVGGKLSAEFAYDGDGYGSYPVYYAYLRFTDGYTHIETDIGTHGGAWSVPRQTGKRVVTGAMTMTLNYDVPYIYLQTFERSHGRYNGGTLGVYVGVE